LTIRFLKVFRHLWGVMLILLLIPLHAKAVDLDQLESTVSTQLCKGGSCRQECDEALTRRVGHDLPADADTCHAKEQYRLLAKGLYRTEAGKILSLNHEFKPVFTQQHIDVPDIQQQKVKDKASPYVIDLQGNLQPGKVKGEEIKQRTFHVNTEAGGLVPSAHAEPLPRHDSVKKAPSVSSMLGCKSFATFGHRGGPSAPENSIPAVLSGLKDMHNGVEIDTQRLSDGAWVVHHDPMIGRSSYGANGFVNLLSSADWKQVYLLDRKGGQTRVKAPLLKDLLQAFRKQAVKGQVINIEIKMVRRGQYSCNQLADLNQQVLSILRPEQFLYTSTYLDALQCMRNVNHGVYLGLIIEPNDKSLQRVINTNYGAEFRSVQQHVPAWLQGKLKQQHHSNREWLSHSDYIDLAELIGPNFGLEIDYRDIEQVADKMQTSGGRWMIYELNDDQGMLDTLKARKNLHKSMPPAIIIDAPRQRFCHAL